MAATDHDDLHEHAPHPSVTEARGAITTRRIRWVLAVSLSLTGVAVVAAWFWVSNFR